MNHIIRVHDIKTPEQLVACHHLYGTILNKLEKDIWAIMHHYFAVQQRIPNRELFTISLTKSLLQFWNPFYLYTASRTMSDDLLGYPYTEYFMDTVAEICWMQ